MAKKSKSAKTAPWAQLPTVKQIIKAEMKSPEFTHEYLSEGERIQVILELQRIAKEQGLTVRELARRMGTSPAQVSRLLNTKRTGAATITTLTKFARATGMLLTVMFESPTELATQGGCQQCKQISKICSEYTGKIPAMSVIVGRMWKEIKELRKKVKDLEADQRV